MNYPQTGEVCPEVGEVFFQMSPVWGGFFPNVPGFGRFFSGCNQQKSVSKGVFNSCFWCLEGWCAVFRGDSRTSQNVYFLLYILIRVSKEF
jgi:hypothetical protein